MSTSKIVFGTCLDAFFCGVVSVFLDVGGAGVRRRADGTALSIVDSVLCPGTCWALVGLHASEGIVLSESGCWCT